MKINKHLLKEVENAIEVLQSFGLHSCVPQIRRALSEAEYDIEFEDKDSTEKCWGAIIDVYEKTSMNVNDITNLDLLDCMENVITDIATIKETYNNVPTELMEKASKVENALNKMALIIDEKNINALLSKEQRKELKNCLKDLHIESAFLEEKEDENAE